VKLMPTERPSMLPAFPQAGVLGRSVAATAHVCVVGRPAARAASVVGVPQSQRQVQRWVAAAAAAAYGTKGTSGSTGRKINVLIDGASGVPPRGRPV